MKKSDFSDPSGKLFVSCVSNVNYLPGIYALHASLRKTNSRYPFYVMIPDNADPRISAALAARQIAFFTMPPLEFDHRVLQNNKVKYWIDTLFKLNLFRLTACEKIVYLDADMIVLNPIDELFEKPHMSGVIAGQSIHPEWDGLNSGMMVIVPSIPEFIGLMEITPEVIRICQSKDHGFGDQNVINHYFSDWKNKPELHLPEFYNALYGAGVIPYQRSIAAKYHIGIDDFKILHFIGKNKPWHHSPGWQILYFLRLLLRRDFVELKAWRLYRNFLFACK